MSRVYLLRYNNYYNRILKKFDSVYGYLPYLVTYKNNQQTDPNGNTAVINNVNFFDNDYINTTLIVNWDGAKPDYILVTEPGKNEFIKSRWFVISYEQTRGGQIKLYLHRDLISDYYSTLMSDSTAIFVEKAIVPSSNNLIFNSENMTYNQIKTREVLLKDDTQCPWIVLYGARKNGEGNDTTFSSTFKTIYPFIEITQEQYNDLYEWAERPNAPTNYRPIYKIIQSCITLVEALNGKDEAQVINLYSDLSTTQSSTTLAIPEGATLKDNALSIVDSIGENIITQVGNLASAYITGVMPDYYDALILNQNRILKYTAPDESKAKYYQINIHSQGESSLLPRGYTGALENDLEALKVAFTQESQVTIGNGIDDNITASYKALYVRFTLDEIPEPTTQGDGDVITISSNRYHLVDAPYDMFCLPFTDELFIKNSKKSSFQQIKSNKFLNLSAASQLIADYAGVGQIYDAQILPYCPISDHLITTDTAGNLIYDINDANSQSYSLIQASEGMGVIGYILHASRSSFALKIPLEEPIVIKDYKIESECDLYRLNSPNYAAGFEFNAAKNGGISFFNVQCTYKPFNPYIKLYPNFGRLYGNDFNDARGLICSGDFSLPTLTDQWKTFEYSNKNYQASFDRQIQHLEINNSIQKERDIWGASAGVFSGAMQGANAGMSAGPIGAVVGGVIGGGASLLGGVRDIELNDKLRQEAIDYTKDQFGYQLGNIKALPQTLTRTSAYVIDNKYFPFLEYYTCSDIEKEALRKKIKFNGMTVMAIGNMKYYKDNYKEVYPMYFKGQLIRVENFNEDYHILNAIADELNKGVFI